MNNTAQAPAASPPAASPACPSSGGASGAANYLANTSFSSLLPKLQLVVDSTSLGEFKLCPRRYQYGIIEGWRNKAPSVHLDFGTWLHGGVERYWRHKARGHGHDESTEQAVQWVLEATWNKTLGRGWVSDHKVKNRLSLVRTLVWYLDEKAQNDSLETIILSGGQPAVELSFTVNLGVQTSTGEEFKACGHLDRLALLNNEPYVVDIKSTSGALDGRFFDGFSPDNQMSFYSAMGQIVWDVPLRGVIIDGAQIGVTFSRFQRGLIPRTQSQLDEWLQDLEHWLEALDRAAQEDYWPMNDKSCTGPYGDCPFRPVCYRPPGARQQWLESDYRRGRWDPAKARLEGRVED